MNQEELRCYLKKEEEQTFNDLCEKISRSANVDKGSILMHISMRCSL
jgi:hypothetical protein